MRQTATKVKRRKLALRRAGHTYDDLARLADVTYSMAWKYMNAVRVSEKCDRAFSLLTGNGRKAN